MSAFCTQCGAALGEGVKFCGACGARRAEAKPATVAPAQGERRSMTVLFADLVGSTQMIDGRDPRASDAGLTPSLVLLARPS